eukprot:jgi/Astpho2/8410/Aster-x1499
MVTLPALQLLPLSKAEAGPLQLPFEWDPLDLPSLLPPEPVQVPRRILNQQFAVLLLRSAYEVQFWRLRRDQYESYLLQYSPVSIKQGQLSDPLYWDFISFAQAATVAQEIPKGKFVFQEFCDECTNQTRLVRRDPALRDNSQLRPEFELRTGLQIYRGLRKGFRGETFSGVPPVLSISANLSQVLESVQQLVNVFVQNGFALMGRVAPVEGSNSQFTVSWKGAANQWGKDTGAVSLACSMAD